MFGIFSFAGKALGIVKWMMDWAFRREIRQAEADKIAREILEKDLEERKEIDAIKREVDDLSDDAVRERLLKFVRDKDK
jgi:hypothetical protein